MTERFITRQAVFVIARNNEHKVLLQQRAKTGYLDGYWDFPSGHVEYGESLLETASRETLEEVGLAIEPDDLKLVHIDQFFVDFNYVNYIFEATRWSGTPTIREPEKCSALGWFAVDSLPSKCVNAVRAAEAAGFTNDLTFSVTNAENYPHLIEPRY